MVKTFKPLIEISSCQATDTEILVDGKVHCVCDDGNQATCCSVKPYAIQIGHNDRVSSDKPAVVYKF